MADWQIGDVAITRVVEVEAALPGGGETSMVMQAYPDAVKEIGWLRPHFATEEGHIRVAIQALLIETPGNRIVVDTCVDTVLCTHLHVDHVGWNTMLVDGKWVPTFPKARYLIGKREWDFWSTEDDEDNAPVLADSVQPIFDAGLADLVADDHVVCEEVRLRPTPGHTPGHVSIVISSKGETAIITGDLMHHPCQMARTDWRSAFDTDGDMAEKTRHAFLAEMADENTLVIGTHFATPAAGHVKRDGEGYRLEV